MPTFNLRRFSDADFLKKIDQNRLHALLEPYTEYFQKRGVKIPSGKGTALDYEELAGVFLAPDDGLPPALVDALYLIDEMGTEEGMQELMEAIEKTSAKDRISLDAAPDPTPADVATQVWLKDRNLLERKHAEQFVGERKSFEDFLSKEIPKRDFELPNPKKIGALEKDLGQWFLKHKKGDQVRVFAYPKPDGVWFLVRHGEAFRREGAQKEGRSESIFYRPEKHDVVVYNPVIGELRINAATKGEKDLYRQKFGKHFFSGEDHFPATNQKYTLDPLRTDGEASLVCVDVEGIEWIRLVEIVYFWGGAQNEIEIRKAGDIFASLKERERKIQNAKIIGARFKIKFADCKAPRSCSIRPPNATKFTRDGDAQLLETWLTKRGFIQAARPESHEKDRTTLARA